MTKRIVGVVKIIIENNMSADIEITSREVDLAEVFTHYVKSFTKPNEKIFKYESVVDTAKGKVMFRIYVDKNTEQLKP